MSIAVILSLQDHTGAIYKEIPIEFSETATLKHLMEKIASIWQIKEEYQVLIKRSEQLLKLNSTLQQIGLQENDKIVVKHAFAENWSVFLKRYETLKRLPSNENEQQGHIAQSLLEMIEFLNKENFFHSYPKLIEECDRICSDVREYLAGFSQTIESAAHYFFFDLKKNDRSDPSIYKIHFTNKTEGVHSGRICTVIDYDGKTTYFIKTNYGGPRKSNSRSGMAPNLREIFGYSLLQLIGVGPESHFICPPPGTATKTIFIATKSIPDFKAKQMDKLNSRSKNIKATLIEIHVLCSLFCITDVHQDNCGQIDNRPVIIDFAIIEKEEGYRREDVRRLICEGTPAPVDTLCNGIANKELRRVVDCCSEEERINIAKAAMLKWNLTKNIEKAKVRTVEVKNQMREKGFIIEKTDDFARYVADVKYNCDLLL